MRTTTLLISFDGRMRIEERRPDDAAYPVTLASMCNRCGRTIATVAYTEEDHDDEHFPHRMNQDAHQAGYLASEHQCHPIMDPPI